MKYPVFGSTTIGGTAATIGDCLEVTRSYSLLGTTITPGRIFWLRECGFVIGSGATRAAGGLALIDAAAGVTTISPTSTSLRYVMQGATITNANGGACDIFKFAAPGLKFTSGYVSIIKLASVGGAVTCTATGYSAAWGFGYEE